MLVACALLVRLIVPTGYMPAVAHGRIAVVVCPDAVPAQRIAAAAMHHGEAGRSHGDGAPTQMPCAFSGLSLAAPHMGDPGLVVGALPFAFLLVVRAGLRLPPALPARLRPPLRAPPAAA